MEQSDPVFLDDPSILVNVDRLIEFFPTSSMTPEEQTNAMVRLVTYSSLLWAFYYGNGRSLRLGLLMVAVIALMWKNQTLFTTSKPIEFMTPMGPNGVYEDGPMPTIGAPPSRVVQIENAPCQMPTAQNPFMNTNVLDGPEKLPACRGPGVQQMAENLLNDQLYTDPTDLYGRRQMQHAFYTLPSTQVPNDREQWANWLFKDTTNCRNNSDACAPLDDLRRQKAFPVDYVNQEQDLF